MRGDVRLSEPKQGQAMPSQTKGRVKGSAKGVPPPRGGGRSFKAKLKSPPWPPRASIWKKKSTDTLGSPPAPESKKELPPRPIAYFPESHLIDWKKKSL
jgi:hypothetical protein